MVYAAAESAVYVVSYFDPTVVWIHMKSHRLVEVKERLL